MTTTDWLPHPNIALGFVNSKTGEIAALYPDGGWYAPPKCSKTEGDELKAYLRKAMVTGFPSTMSDINPHPSQPKIPPSMAMASPILQDPYGRVIGAVDSLSLGCGSHHIALIPQALRDIAANLAVQDCRMTNNPQFLVQKKIRQTGFDTDYSDSHIWIDIHGDYSEVTEPKTIERLEGLDDKYILTEDEKSELGDYIKTGYIDRWETVQPFFTEVEANHFIEANKHRHNGELRTYVDSAYHNPEWQAIRNFLLSLNPPKQSLTTT